MARSEIKGLAVGVVQDRAGNVVAGVTYTCSGTVFAASTGATALTGGQLVTNADGELPGWIDPGTYTITVGAKTVTFDTQTGVSQAALDLVESNAAAADVVLRRVKGVAPFRAIYDPADYGATYNGTTDDSAAIQAAIDACSAAGGGIVDLSGSILEQAVPTQGAAIKINTTLVMKSSVWLRGRGASTVFIGTANPMIRLPTSGVIVDKITMSDFHLNTPAGVGIHLDTTGQTGGLGLGFPRITLDNITVNDAQTYAFQVVLSGVFGTIFNNCVSLRSVSTGFLLSMTDSHLVNCIAAESTNGDGFNLGGGNNKLSACKAYGCDLGYGFALVGAGRHMLSACESQDNKYGYGLISSFNTLGGCLSDTDSNSGFIIDGSDNCLAGVSAMYGGGGTGAVTRVGFHFRQSNSVAPVRNIIVGTSNATAPVGGSIVGNTVTVRNGENAVQRPAYAATLTPDPFAGGTVQQTLAGAVTISAPTSGFVGQRLRFVLTQDATGGRVATFNAAYRTSWTPDTTTAKTNIIEFFFDGRYWQQDGVTTGLTSVVAMTDSFNRVDAVTLGTTDTGQVWSNVRGGGQIVTNEAKGGGTGFLNFADNVVVIESGTPNATVSVKLPNGSGDGEGVAFRVVDTNNYWALVNKQLYKRVAGVTGTVYAGAGFAAVANDRVGVVLSGPSIVVTLNGVAQYSLADPDLMSATKHGLYFASTNSRLDDFSIV